MKAKNTVTINGKTYDARTGGLVSHTDTKKLSPKKAAGVASPAPKGHKAATKPPAKKRGNGFVDGIARHPQSDHTKNLAVTHKKKVSSLTAPSKHVASVSRSAHAASASHAKPKHSMTLHRSSVKAPSIIAPTVSTHSAKKKVSHTPVERAHRASSTSRSTAISRFGSFGVSSKPIEDKKTTSDRTLSMANIAHAAERARSANSSQRIKHQLIADSLAAANAQAAKPAKKPKKARQSPKIIHFAVGGFAALVLGAYVTYLNVPALSMKVASSRAGFAATYPGQTPSGYGMRGPIAYSPGQVVINFGSNTDDRRFSLQQQPTTWDSVALKENYVAKNSSGEPLTYQDSGLTIYIYNGGDAAWVNDGKFYTIRTNNSQLDTKQILDIATSM